MISGKSARIAYFSIQTLSNRGAIGILKQGVPAMLRPAKSFLVIFATLSVHASSAQAQCDFNAVSATKLRVPLVRDLAACPSSQHPAPNTTALLAVGPPPTEACAPVLVNDLDQCAISHEICETDASCPAKVCDVLALNAGAGCDIDAECDGDLCIAAPGNTCSGTGLVTAYRFGPKGGCTLSARSKVEKDCSKVKDGGGDLLGLAPIECHVSYVSVRCKDILRSDGSPADGIADQGFTITGRVQATIDDATNNDLSLIEFPITFYFSDPDQGSMSITTSSAEMLLPLVGTTNSALPPCTQINLVNVKMRDPDSRPFASVGMGTRP